MPEVSVYLPDDLYQAARHGRLFAALGQQLVDQIGARKVGSNPVSELLAGQQDEPARSLDQKQHCDYAAYTDLTHLRLGSSRSVRM
jgi:hypothetical protein